MTKNPPHKCEEPADVDGVEVCGCGHGYGYAIAVLTMIRDQDCGNYEPHELADKALSVIAGGG